MTRAKTLLRRALIDLLTAKTGLVVLDGESREGAAPFIVLGQIANAWAGQAERISDQITTGSNASRQLSAICAVRIYTTYRSGEVGGTDEADEIAGQVAEVVHAADAGLENTEYGKALIEAGGAHLGTAMIEVAEPEESDPNLSVRHYEQQVEFAVVYRPGRLAL